MSVHERVKPLQRLTHSVGGTTLDPMPLLLQDDEMEALEAALSFADTFPDASSHQEHHIPPPKTTETSSSSPYNLDQLLHGTPHLTSEHANDAFAFTTITNNNANLQPMAMVNVGASNLTNQDRDDLQTQKEPTTKTKRRVQANPNRARNERKLELAYLKNKVGQMETELETLRRHRPVKSLRNDSVSNSMRRALVAPRSNSTVSMERSPHVWRGIAQRQQKRREKSERENARLKMVLESQVKLAKSLETLLQKRIQKQVSGCAESIGCSADYYSQGYTLDLLGDRDAFEALFKSVETAYAEMDTVFTTNGLLGMETPGQDARMREGAIGLYLDVFATKVFPFEFEDVATAVWNHFRGNDKHNGVVYENATKNLETSSDIIMEAFTMEVMDRKSSASFRNKQVVRRYVETDRQVVVWVGRGHGLQQTNSPFSSFGFVEKGYVVTRRPAALIPGHKDFTIVQMCTLSLPQMAAGCSIDRTAAGDFTEFVLNVIAASASASQELIENVLLEQTLKKRQES